MVLLKIEILKILQTYELQYLHVQRVFFFLSVTLVFFKRFLQRRFPKKAPSSLLIMFSTKFLGDFKTR